MLNGEKFFLNLNKRLNLKLRLKFHLVLFLKCSLGNQLLLVQIVPLGLILRIVLVGKYVQLQSW